MKHKFKHAINEFSQYMEMMLSIILGFVIVVLTGRLILNLFNSNYLLTSTGVLSFFLENAMDLAIGIELIKMLVQHEVENIIEVLLFAISRQIIVAHPSFSDTFIGISCIALLFVIRKFLFIHPITKNDSTSSIHCEQTKDASFNSKQTKDT